MHREGSIGLPFPDTYYKIVTPGTDEELPYGEEGEILLAGPTVMLRVSCIIPRRPPRRCAGMPTVSPGYTRAIWA